MLFKFALFLFSITIIMAENLSDEEKFAQFKTKFNKVYETPEEEQQRFGVFVENVKKIDTHNAKFAEGKVSFTQGINQFTDLTPEEWKHRNHGYRPVQNL